MRRLLNSLYWTSGLLAASSFVMIVLLVLSQIGGRWVGLQVKSADEIAGYFLAASLFLALAPTFRHGEHIRVGLVMAMLGPVSRRGLEIACLLFATALIGYFTYSAVDMVWTSYEIDDVSQGLLPIPLWLPQSAMAVGMLIFLMSLADDLVAVLANRKASFMLADEAKAASGDIVTFER